MEESQFSVRRKKTKETFKKKAVQEITVKEFGNVRRGEIGLD